jgi:hypothetical protein
MKYHGLIRARKATIGGLAIKLDPYIFQQLVDREDLPVVHGIRGVFNKNHIYLVVHDGMTFFTKVKDPLPGIRVRIEVDKLESYMQL